MGAYILIFVIMFSLWLRFTIRRNSRLEEQSNNSLLEQEVKANSVRRKPIDKLDYITISEKTIPFLEINDEILEKSISEIKRLGQTKMLNLNGISNTDLKLTYGPANLPELTECDEHFISLCNQLSRYSSRLMELGYTSEAIQVMEFSIDIGSGVTSVYRKLGQIYFENGEFDKIDSLLEKTEALTPLTKKSISKYLESLKQNK